MPFVKGCLVLVGLAVATLVITIGVFQWRASASINATIDEIRAAGDPATLNDLEPEPIPASENAATYLLDSEADVGVLLGQLMRVAFPEPYDPASGLAASDARQASSLFAASPEIWDAMRDAARCEQWVWPLKYQSDPQVFMADLLQSTTIFRSAARLHVAKSRTLAAAGQADQAAMACLQGLKLVRLQDRMPMTVSALTNAACRGSLLDELDGLLRHSKLTKQTHQAIEDELARADSLATYRTTLKSERAFGLASFQSMSGVAGGFLATAQASEYLELMDQMISQSDSYPYQDKPSGTTQSTGLAGLVAPSIEMFRKAYFRTLARIRQVRALNRGDLPTDPSRVPLVDPWSGELIDQSDAKDSGSS